jgi:PAS domain S-box-containing protein
MNTKILEYIDFEKVNTLLEGFNNSTGFVTAILDLEGNVLSKSGWRKICTEFHRQNHETSKKCSISDTVLSGELKNGEKYHFYKCLNGLVDVAVPIIINGEHVANLFSGQFFFEEPDKIFFQEQAIKYGFDEISYLKALENVPIVSELKVKIVMDFLLNMTQIISDMTYQKFELIELNNSLLESNKEYSSLNEEYQSQCEELIYAKNNAEESEARLRAIFENSIDAIGVTKKNGIITYANPSYVNLFGYNNLDELIGISVVNQIAPQYRDIMISSISNKTNNNFLPTKFETVGLRKDGSEFPFEIKVSGYELNNEKFNIGIIRDITEQKNEELRKAKNNLELITAKEKAEESDRLKTAFLQNMSHEIRTPMNAIMGFADILPDNFNDKEKLTYFSNIISQRSNDLLDIINDILDIAKIESGQVSVINENCNIDNLFTDLKLFFAEHQIRINKQHINFDIVSHFNTLSHTIVTDKVKLRQIYINLFTNAFKFTSEGRIEGGCKMDKNGKLIFYVSDTGIGIPKDKYQYVFERFSQLQKGESRLYGGTGLGLSIVKGLVNLLGGKIWLESEQNKGTTFYFTINYENNLKNEFSNMQDDTINDFLNFQNKTILIVEDDPYNMSLIDEILSNKDIHLLHAIDGKSAVDVLFSNSIDLVLMDIGLPDISGYEVIKQMLNQQPSLKIIAQTAFATSDDKIKTLKAGCLDFISKPLKANKLLSLINKHI